MIAFLLDEGWLELATTSISVEIANPLFSYDAVPGTTTYPFTVPMSPANMRRLNFPHLSTGAVAPVPAQAHLDGVLWRVGALLYDGADEEKRQYEYRFVSDAGERQSRIEGRSLRELALGTIPMEARPDHPDYALPCWRNRAFYGDNNPDFCGILNHYAGGQYSQNSGAVSRFAFTPMPRLLPTLRRVMAAFDYRIEGTWLDEDVPPHLIIWSCRAVDHLVGGANVLPATFELAKQLPDITVGEFLVGIQKLFALGYTFDPVRRVLRITSLRDVVADPAYVDRTGRMMAIKPAAGGGYQFTMGLESSDELNKTLDTSWARLTVGDGKNKVDSAFGTLHMVYEADAAVASPVTADNWLVPAAELKGTSAEFELGDDGSFGLRLLIDRGLRPDAGGDLYPLAIGATEPWAGVSAALATAVGTHSLWWAGATGLYARRHQAWLAFLAAAGSREGAMQFRVADLLALAPARKEMVNGQKYLWEKVSLTLSTTRRLESARITYRHIRV